MEQIVVIINGIKLPDHLVDYAVSKAKENSAGLLALFLAGEDKETGYIFPSDLDAAQDVTNDEDAEEDDLRVIRSKMKLVADTAKAEGVACSTELMVEPSLEDVVSKAKAANLVLIDANYEEAGLMPVTSFEINDLIDQLGPRVEKVAG